MLRGHCRGWKDSSGCLPLAAKWSGPEVTEVPSAHPEMHHVQEQHFPRPEGRGRQDWGHVVAKAPMASPKSRPFHSWKQWHVAALPALLFSP